MTQRILLVGGGSTGHLAPLVAVWREIEKAEPQAKVFALATDRGSDAAFLQREKIPYALAPYPWRNVMLPWTLARGFWRAAGVLQSLRPTVVLSKGGLVSLPVCLLAALRRVPIVVHESDAVMGGGTSLVRRLASKVCLGIDSGLRAPNTVVTGNPVRPEITAGSRERALKLTGLSGQKPILLVTGGSQGAEAINRALIAALPRLLPAMDVIHLTGPNKSAGAAQSGYYAAPHSGDAMGDLYAAATLALMRGGAGSISECAATGTPAVIVPLEGLAHDHQLKNAERAAAGGGCVLLRQRDLERLPDLLLSLATDEAKLRDMRVAVRGLQSPEAARLIADIVLEAGAAR